MYKKHFMHTNSIERLETRSIVTSLVISEVWRKDTEKKNEPGTPTNTECSIYIHAVLLYPISTDSVV